jgi:hypothetical protein
MLRSEVFFWSVVGLISALVIAYGAFWREWE